MSAAATVLVLLSAFLHAGWNIFSKKHSPTAGFFALASWGTVCCFSPVLFWTTDILPLLWSVIWWKLLLAGFFQAVYYLGLAGAYQRGALSIAYPLARAFPLCILVVLALRCLRPLVLQDTLLLMIISWVSSKPFPEPLLTGFVL